MSEDERAKLPPSFRPVSGGSRPDPRTARPVGPREPTAQPAHPRRHARPARGSSEAAPRPAQRPAGRGRTPDAPPPSYSPRGAQPSSAGTTAAPPRRPVRAPAPPAPSATGRRRRRRPGLVLLGVLLVVLLAWPIGLLIWANGKIQHVDALTGAPGTAGTTYLLAGSDSRADGAVADATEGQRSDTIMVMHVPDSGPTALVSLPRDTLVEIPGYGPEKLNTSYSLGGPPLLAETVEQLTGLTVDHYVEIGMGGVQEVVDAVGGVELCLDYDVDDELSGLRWTAGCRVADGPTALAFARMRYADPNGDIGRADRQRQVIGAVMREVAAPATLVNPVDHVQLVEAGTGALVTDTDTGIVDLGRMALAFRNATGPDGVTGAPPIADFDYRPGTIGSTVLLDEDLAPQFFQRLRDGELTPSDVRTPG